jgi:glycosyltransferase involved in cell wall biosynthesis
MSEKPRVSIITPSFNQAQYLEQTIQSVLGQGYPDLEYILVDGASTDGSVEIIRRYAPYLKYWVSEPDHGQAEAINKGFVRATGDIIAWINSDDFYFSGTVVAAVEALRCHPEWGMVFGDVLSVDGAGNTINVMRYDHWGLQELLSFHIIGQPAVFMRRSVLEQAGYLDPHFHFLLDHHLWLRIANLTPVGYIPQVWAAGRFHADAKNIAQAAVFGQDAYDIVEWLRTDPEFETVFYTNQRKIVAGAHWLNAWYLSEGGVPGKAMKSYARSFFLDPRRTLKDWRRLLYTFLSLFDRETARKIYLAMRQRHQPQLEDLPRVLPVRGSEKPVEPSSEGTPEPRH